MSDRQALLAVLLLWGYGPVANADTASTSPPRMSVVVGKDVSGTVFKKLGLPSRQYCWDACLKEERCSGVRWGVVGADEAGLCILLTGPLAFKDLVEPKTDDGKPIHVTGARKDPATGGGT